MAEVKFSKKDNGLDATISISITKEDYQPAVEKQLKKYQQKASVPGFRPGKAPIGLIRREYGKSVYIDEVNRLVSDKLFDYIKANKINFLAQPLTSGDAESKVNFDVEEDFLFHFDLGLSPDFELNLSKNDVLTRYKIAVSDETIEKEIGNIRRRYAQKADADTIEDNDVVYVVANEINENGEKVEGGISDKRVSLTPKLIEDADTKALFIGAKKGDTIKVNIHKVFNNNPTVIASTFGIEKAAVNDLFETFDVTVDEINRWIDADVNQELWDQIYGSGVVTTEADFKQKVAEQLENYFTQEAEHHLEHEINHLLTDKHPLDLPENFLKRWLMETNSDRYNPENVDESFAKERSGFAYSLVQQKMQEVYDLKVEEIELKNAAFGYVYNMFMQYGMYNVTPEQISDFASKELQKDDFRRQMYDIALNRQIIQKVKELVTTEEKEIGEAEFYSMLQAHNQTHHA